ncbi:MAG TPA: DUF3810 domain-containing protein [Candidatus Enterocloster excrementigallinarum]|uniref:DUF3810 domain-containing protein n=1 Tax=Candidatus Enterocloster excrementigallinarum TaxID=2838558 RepID=A0A9D2TEF8_9FIRM|nr:DUF3810 domain-containing protein [Candidatus Enterocloster excrementigallinarum]
MNRLSTNRPFKSTVKGRPFPLTVLLTLVFLGAALLLQLAARKVPGFGQWYAVTIYPLITGSLGRFMGIFPFSVTELGLYLLIVLFVVSLVRSWRRPLKILGRLLFGASLLFFLFTVNCGINYYRQPFSSLSGLTIQPSSSQELYDLCSWLVEQIQDSVRQLEDQASEENGFSGQTSREPLPSYGKLLEYGRQGQLAMRRLGEEFPVLAGFYPAPKPLLLSRILSVQQLCGVYSPFTVKANYNREMPLYNIPHTICHELSHLKGFMREDEANFIGYAACIHSEDLYFRYSGYLMGWVYAGNALAQADPEGFAALRSALPQAALTDLSYNNAYWDAFQGKVAEVSTRVNDTYLKLQDQQDGIQSYGRVVDLMLAYHRRQ